MMIGVRSWCMKRIGFYSTDALLGRMFEDAPGVSEGTVQRLRKALMGMFED
jgi:hypothetical protein